MRRLGRLILVYSILASVTPLAFSSGTTGAQEPVATPAAGITFEPVAAGGAGPVTAQAGVQLDWARFAPGASYTVSPNDASLLLIALGSGTLTVTTSAPLVVNRTAVASPTETAAHERIAAGAQFTLHPGDSFVRPADSEQTLRNASGDAAIALFALVAPGQAEQPLANGAPRAEREHGGLVVAVAVVAVPQCPAGYAPAEIGPVATPGGGGGGGGAGGVAVAIAAAPECVGAVAAATPTP